MIRKLASVRRIGEIKPIKNADNLELALIDGWQTVVQKGELKQNDVCIYFEIDSFLPIEERYEFLRKSSYKKLYDGSEGFRLRTIKLRGELSQGLALPFHLFPEIKSYKIGDDVSELLKIRKYEPPLPACLSGYAKGTFPSFIQKTDEERIQNLLEYFDVYKDIEFEVTEKLDGTSASYYFNENIGGVCSRNLELQDFDNNNTYWTIERRLGLLDILKSEKRNLAIQGEIIGEGINSNRLGIKGQEFYVYHIWDIDNRRYFVQKERLDFVLKHHLFHVPILGNAIIFSEFNTVGKLLDYANGISLLNNKRKREGLVFKSTELVENKIISFKAVSNEYLLGGGE